MYSSSPEINVRGASSQYGSWLRARNKSLGDLAGVTDGAVGVVFGHAFHFVEDVVRRGLKSFHDMERIENENIVPCPGRRPRHGPFDVP